MACWALLAALCLAAGDGGSSPPDAGGAGDAGCNSLSDEDRAAAEDLDLLRDLELLKLYPILAPEL
jgi:hypothetical protein